MKERKITKRMYGRIIRIDSPMEFGPINHHITFYVSAEDSFYLLMGLWKNKTDFHKWLKENSNQFVECYVSIYYDDRIVLHFETIYANNEREDFIPVGEGAEILLEKLKQLRDEYNCFKEEYNSSKE